MTTLKFYFIKFLHRFKILKHFNLHCKLFLNSKIYNIPIIGGIGYSNLFMSEQWMIELFEKCIFFKNKTFLDIGANIGQTLLKVKSVYDDIKYIGFEPNPSCIFYLENLITINKFSNVNLYPVGISSNNGIFELYHFNESYVDSSASLVKNFRTNETIVKTINIPLFNIDCITLNCSEISIIKIDVEGGELEVINSAQSIIEKHKPIILIEILPVYNSENIFRLERQNKLQEILFNLGYKLYRINIKNNKLRGFELLNKIEIHSDMNLCEYIFVHNIDTNKFEANILNNQFIFNKISS